MQWFGSLLARVRLEEANGGVCMCVWERLMVSLCATESNWFLWLRYVILHDDGSCLQITLLRRSETVTIRPPPTTTARELVHRQAAAPRRRPTMACRWEAA